MRARRSLTVAAVLVAGVATAVPAQASHSWSGYHWGRTANPFTLALGDDVSTTWDGYLRTSSTQWSTSTVLDTAVVAGSTTPKQCRATAGRVEVCSAAYGRTGWLGLASISLRGSHITQGTVKVNDTYFAPGSQYDNAAERSHVMCQEIGHTLGLDHTSTDGSSQGTCMDYSQSASSTAPNQHDYEQLATVYGHQDSASTVGAFTAASAAQPGNDRSSWGREVRRSADGKHSTFVRDLGDDQTVVTDVTWAA